MIDLPFEFQILRASRTRLLHVIENNSETILFTIPQGFNNNIIWHIGHCITSQQRHMYMRSGLPMRIPKAFEDTFKTRTSPREWQNIPDIDQLKRLLLETVDQLELDIKSNLFTGYTPFNLPIGFKVTNHLEALQAANFHEAEH